MPFPPFSVRILRTVLLVSAALALLLGARSAAADRPLVPRDTLPDEPRTVVLEQPDAPLTVVAYEAAYEGVRLFQADGIRHEVVLRNSGDRRVDAFRLAFVMFSVFNDVIGEKSGVSLDALPVDARVSSNWTYDDLPDAATFHIGAAYVHKVRFVDGDIWTADSRRIEEQLRRIDEEGRAALDDE